MGVGNRMKKQGPPEPLSEAHFAKLKRKAGLPVDPVEPVETKRRRTNKKNAPKTNGAAAKKNDAKKSKAPAPAPKANGRGKKAQPVDDEDEDMSDDDDLGDFHDAPSDMSDDEGVDEFSNLKNAPAGLGDDFLDSDNDSVFDSDQEQGGGKHMFSEDEDESDGEEKLTKANIEGVARRLDMKIAAEDAEAQAELEEMGIQTNIDGDKPHVFDDEDDELAAKTKTLLAPDLQLLRTRITENIRVLDDFANLHEEGRSRVEYVSQLIKDICAYYGYSEYLAEKLFNLFSPREAFAFFEANESARPVVIRTNTLRTHRRDLAQALISRGVTLEPVGKWSKVGLQIFESNVPLGATPEYLAGYYILQAASSFLPVMALEPQENERVLDMAAAPGGKTTHMAAMMKNTGVIVANDPSKQRAKGLIGNIHRLGARNVVVSNYDAREFPKPMGGFDRVLLDAPCSGTGVIAKDASVKTNKTERDFMLLPHMQKQLILAAIDSVNHHSKTGGYIVYSTCSVTVEENEAVVQYALSRRPNVRLVDTNLPFGREGFTSYMGKKFDPSLKLTRRYYPHTYNVDGFFVAKFQKFGPTPAKAEKADRSAPGSAGEVVDKTPITDDEDNSAAGRDDNFGGFDEDEDEEYIDKAKRNAMRRRGLDPNALKAKAKKEAAAKKDGGKSDKSESEVETEKPAEKTPEKKDKSKEKAAAADKERKAERNTAQKKVTSTTATPEKSPKSKAPKQKKDKKAAK
ncbi:NOL1/NOP2/sun family protein [Colletotrichum graminicola]|uniref:Nucleolar protein 2 n=1 Tax=Colletotrichum graminicola (strain M1.001 / M2 / FGSC 10212) TaxID=645133 RepID=E3QGM6_COLGM|nr:NOL1/NOP2/sun family protein [Colletotrichum graminicola M1.001]EFQ30014.1 NOL1/NOP2/sun family protein [Colletotrichum graminicola M1.001]WDK09825.1 NOL1/NOP2/sun family protein [Colletotrichum graminicola]